MTLDSTNPFETPMQAFGSSLHVNVDNLGSSAFSGSTITVFQGAPPWSITGVIGTTGILGITGIIGVTGTLGFSGFAGVTFPLVGITGIVGVTFPSGTIGVTFPSIGITGLVGITSAQLDSINSALSVINANMTNGNLRGSVGISGLVQVGLTQFFGPTSVISRVSGVTASTILLASNTNRKAAYFFNESPATAYVKLGITATITSYTLQMNPNSFLAVNQDPVFTGEIDGVWAGASGAMQVTELT